MRLSATRQLWDCQQRENCEIVSNEAHSYNHCCSGKAIRITYSTCLCSLRYPAYIAHAPYYTAICGLPRSTMFYPRYLIDGKIFGKKLLNTKCVFWFCLQLLSETFLILRRIERDSFFHVIPQTAQFSKKSYWTQNVCFDFLYNFCLKHFSF